MERLFLYINLIEKRNSNDITFFILACSQTEATLVMFLPFVPLRHFRRLQRTARNGSAQAWGLPSSPVMTGRARKTCQASPPAPSWHGPELSRSGAVTVRGSERASSALTFLWLQRFISVTIGLLPSVHSETVFFSGGNFIVQGKIFFNLSKDVIKSA